jgi:hypothetical protein
MKKKKKKKMCGMETPETFQRVARPIKHVG